MTSAIVLCGLVAVVLCGAMAFHILLLAALFAAGAGFVFCTLATAAEK